MYKIYKKDHPYNVDNVIIGVIFVNKKGFIAVIIFCSIIIFSGFTIVTARLPEFIKNDSSFKINCTLSPFDFSVDMGQYSVCINNKIGYNFKNGTKKLANLIGEKVYSGICDVTDKTGDIFKNIEGQFTK